MPWMKILGFIGQVGSVLTSVVGGALTLINNMIGAGMRSAMQYHEESIALARSVGMSYKESVAYSNVLVDRAIELGRRYGIAAEAVKEIQSGIMDATGKQYMLNNDEAERAIQINKLVGANTNNAFMEQMMNHMGGQLSAVQGAIAKSYVTAAKNGLTAAKFSEKVAKNLTLANKLSFRDGVNGIIRMTALSEKLGFNLQSIEGAADKFMELDKSIESAAQLQMLGGAAGAYGANPLTMSYEANYDPEAFTKRMTNMLGGYATFDRKTGMANVNGMNRDFVKNIAQAMGISMDEAMSIAKKQAEVKYKESAFAPQLNNLRNQDQRNFILNKSYVDPNTGQLMINDASGKAHNISERGIEGIIEELQKFDNQSEKDIMREQSEKLTSINEKIGGIWTTLGGHLAKVFEKHLPDIQKFIDRIGDSLIKAMPRITAALDSLINRILKPENLDSIEGLIDKVIQGSSSLLTSMIKFFDESVKFLEGIENKAQMILGAIIGWGFYKSYQSFMPKAMGGGATGGAQPSPNTPSNTPPPSGGGNANPRNSSIVKHNNTSYRQRADGSWQQVNKDGTLGKVVKNKDLKAALNAKQQLNMQQPNTPSTSTSTSTQPQNASSGAKPSPRAKLGARAGASAVAVVIGSIQGYMAKKEYDKAEEEIIKNNDLTNEQKKEQLKIIKEERNRAYGASIGGTAGSILGGIAGSFAGPGAGTMIGGIGGSMAGSWVGDMIGGLFNADVSDEDLEELIKEYKAEKHANGGIVGAMPKETVIEKHDIGGIVGGNSFSGDKILTGLNSGEMVLNKDQQAQLFKFISNASNILTKVGESNGVTYYNASSKNSNLYSSYDTSRISSITDNRSIREKHLALHSNSSNALSNILSTIFNSNSNVVSTALNTDNGIKTIPFGENSFRKIPRDISNDNGNKVTEITVKDININVDGTIKLDGGSSSKDIDINKLLSDHAFIASLKEIITNSINTSINSGRYMNDNSTLRGGLNTTVWGR